MVAHNTVRTYGINQVFSPTTALESSMSPRQGVASSTFFSSSSSIYYFHVKLKPFFLSVSERNIFVLIYHDDPVYPKLKDSLSLFYLLNPFLFN